MIALSRCQNQGFSLRRVDNNADSVRFLLKNVVIPPPKRPHTDPRVAQRLISGHIGNNGGVSSQRRQQKASGAAQHDRMWRESEAQRLREERERKKGMTSDRNTAWDK